MQTELFIKADSTRPFQLDSRPEILRVESSLLSKLKQARDIDSLRVFAAACAERTIHLLPIGPSRQQAINCIKQARLGQETSYPEPCMPEPWSAYASDAGEAARATLMDNPNAAAYWAATYAAQAVGNAANTYTFYKISPRREDTDFAREKAALAERKAQLQLAIIYL